MAYLFFFGLTRIPLAQAIGLSFIAPIITLFLAVPILGERIGANARLAAVLGFGGVMVVVGGELMAVDAGSDLLGIGAVLISAVMYAFNLVLQRMQALVARPLEIAFYQNTIVFTMLLVGVPFAVSWPATPHALGWRRAGGCVRRGISHADVGSLSSGRGAATRCDRIHRFYMGRDAGLVVLLGTCHGADALGHRPYCNGLSGERPRRPPVV